MQRQNEADLAGKVVIITGASRGVGKQNALDFAKRGAKVVLAARTVEPDSKLPGTIGETLAAIEALGGEALAVATDLAKEEDLKRYMVRIAFVRLVYKVANTLSCRLHMPDATLTGRRRTWTHGKRRGTK